MKIGKVEFREGEFTPPEELCRDDLFLRTEYTLVSPGTELDCLTGRERDMALLMDLIKAGRLDTRCLLTCVEKPQNAPSVYARFLAKDPEMLGAVFDWRSI